ncbi:MAG: heavy metal translocating P-type ATPase, partial [Phycisphaerae bacterium]
VRRAGMQASPWKQPDSGQRQSWRQRHGRLIMAATSGALLAAGFVSHAIVHGSIGDALASGDGGVRHVFPPVSVALYVGAIIAGAWFVGPKALTAARRLRPDMNLLMAVAVIGATVIGQWLEAATVTFLFAIALLLESWSVGRARRAIEALMDLSPRVARCLEPDGRIVERAVEDVPVGATVLIRPGEKIPVDGKVRRGQSSVDQAPITGESLPVTKAADDEVFAGTINQDGALEVTATRRSNDSTLARIIHLVSQAQSRRAPLQRWVDVFASRYTPVMMILAAGIAVVPPMLSGGAWSPWLYRGLVILVIACPCALVISTPVSIVAALTAAARNGVLIKGGAFLEASARLKAIALDKTGTLTQGRPEVQQIIPLNGHSAGEVLRRAAALEANSEHPLARAVLERARREGIDFAGADDFQAIKGKGARGCIDGRPVWIGSGRLMRELHQPGEQLLRLVERLEQAGCCIMAVGNDRHVCGLITVADGVRPASAPAIKALRQAGVEHVVMLTGDNAGVARAVGQATGVDEVHAELLPAEKLQAIADLRERFGHVAMVGDGINDAPAMAEATIGIAMGAIGADAAVETADIALMSDDLSKLAWLVEHSSRTLRIVRRNIALAIGVKAVFIALAVAGLATLWMAIAADMGTSLVVIFNGLRLVRADQDSYASAAAGRLTAAPGAL